LLHAYETGVGFDASLLERLGVRNSDEPEGFNIAQLENKIAGRIPLLTRLDLEED